MPDVVTIPHPGKKEISFLYTLNCDLIHPDVRMQTIKQPCRLDMNFSNKKFSNRLYNFVLHWLMTGQKEQNIYNLIYHHLVTTQLHA